MQSVSDQTPQPGEMAAGHFEALLLRETAFVRNMAHHLCHEWAGAEELAQQGLYLMWRNRAQFRMGTNFRGWATAILRNALLSGHRRDRFHGEMTPGLAERRLVAADDPELTQELADVRRALERLTPQHREVLTMTAAGLTYDEIAALVGCPSGTVRSRLSRARDALQAALSGERGEAETERARLCRPSSLDAAA